MLINKWIISSCVNDLALSRIGGVQAGLCFDWRNTFLDFNSLYRKLQENKQLTFSLFFSEPCDIKHFESIVGFFFLPAYYRNRKNPVIFSDAAFFEANKLFFDQLRNKAIAHGFSDIQVISLAHKNDDMNRPLSPIHLVLDGGEWDLKSVVKEWNLINVDNVGFDYINLFVTDISESSLSILQNVSIQENAMSDSYDYKIAKAFYLNNQKIDYFEKKYLDTKNEGVANDFYLSIQKEEIKRLLNFYYYEHEILPLWYKRFGHIIKVLMGKRTFKSLFNDNVKKYKD